MDNEELKIVFNNITLLFEENERVIDCLFLYKGNRKAIFDDHNVDIYISRKKIYISISIQ